MELPDSSNELFVLAKSKFVEKNYKESTDLFSRALEKKTLELQISTPINFELAKYYLWYGDSLLTKEEQTNHLLSDCTKSPNHKNDDSDETGGLVDAQVIIAQKEAEESNATVDDDEEMAFEMFQLAIKSYNSGSISAIDAEDLSYCHMRLGDMLMLQNNFTEAEMEYQQAVDILNKFNLDKKKCSSCYLSLAQSQMFSGKLVVARMSFKTCESLMEDILKLDPNDEVYKCSLEDIKLQLLDLDKIIKEQILEFSKQNKIPAESVQLKQGSQYDTVSLIPKTTDEFDKPLLGGEAITISSAQCKTVTNGNKKKKIDITNLYS